MAKTFNKGNMATSDNRNSPKPDDKLIDELATLGKLAYEQRRGVAAKELGIRAQARQARQGIAPPPQARRHRLCRIGKPSRHPPSPSMAPNW